MWQKDWQIDVWYFYIFGSCLEDEAAEEKVVAWTQTWRAVALGWTKIEVTAV